MSRETEFVREITKETNEDRLLWSNESPGRYADFIFQFNFAYQAFSADYDKNGKNYKLLLVHKKSPSHNADFEIVEERHSTELLVILEGRLLSTFTDYEVDDRDLSALSIAVSEKNKDINDLFK